MAEPVDPVRPVTLKALVGLLWGKAAVLVGLTGWLLYADLSGRAGSSRLANFVTIYSAVYAVFLILAGWAVYSRKSWSRGPAVMLELFLLPIGYYMVTGGQPLLGVPVIVLGLLGVFLALHRRTLEAIGIDLPRRGA
ncbi:hypothetical protein [Longispora fulva]|uniref:Integral membrane protein n=1 Tax=Longispora fulva TaxID=619741 RepID=A0A8J7GPK2_9ACTN|nr:hypothetical protein [Longispora fulva]MBG6140933.1 hypothetical protein [Longispora fulva]